MTGHDDLARSVHRADFDALAEGVVWQDANGAIIDANEAAAPILGLTHEELMGRTSRDPRWYAVREDGSPWPGSEHPGVVALRTGQPQRMQLMGIIAPSVGRRWISIHAMPRFAAGSPRPVGVVASFVDVTSQVEMRNRMQEQARELAELYDEAPCGYHQLDAQGRYLRINNLALKWLGASRDDVIGRRSPRDFLTEEGQRLFDANFPRLKAGEALEGVEVEMVGLDGVNRWLRLNARPVLDPSGHFIATRSVFHDISESRASRMEMERLYAQQQVLLDNDLVGIARTLDRRIIWKNRAFGRMFGYEPAALIGQETAVLFPDRAAFEAFGARFGDTLRRGGSFRATIELRHKDGTPVWADCSGTLLDASTGESVWFSNDVTAARREEALRVQTAELEAANRQLQETAKLHSMFLSNMSHEMRTPLNAIIGFAGILRQPSLSPDLAKRARYVDQIAASGSHLLALIDSMLELARVESGKVPLRREQLDPVVVVREVVDMLETKAREHQVTIGTELPVEMAQVLLDPLRLKQVLLNYLGNAIKFSRAHGRVTVRASMVAPDRLRIEVEDDGIGISDEDQAKLFVRFQQLSAGSTKAYQGTGIGLALVKQIVEAQGGQVGVRSTSGKGSVFWAEIPCPAGDARSRN